MNHLSDSGFPNGFAGQKVAKEDRVTPFVTMEPSHGRKCEPVAERLNCGRVTVGTLAKLATVKNRHIVTFFRAIVNLNGH